LFQAQAGMDVEAEECFQRALCIARAQNARSLQLRAALSLSRLWQTQGKNAPILDLLAGIIHRFTEGFVTPDLQDASLLLEQVKQGK
jgi:predicted ATPase